MSAPAPLAPVGNTFVCTLPFAVSGSVFSVIVGDAPDDVSLAEIFMSDDGYLDLYYMRIEYATEDCSSR